MFAAADEVPAETDRGEAREDDGGVVHCFGGDGEAVLKTLAYRPRKNDWWDFGVFNNVPNRHAEQHNCQNDPDETHDVDGVPKATKRESRTAQQFAASQDRDQNR